MATPSARRGTPNDFVRRYVESRLTGGHHNLTLHNDAIELDTVVVAHDLLMTEDGWSRRQGWDDLTSVFADWIK